MEIVELKANELSLCRKLRLGALKDAPGAFADTYRDATNQAEHYWEAIFKSLTPPNHQRMFIARDSERCYGSVFALLDTDSKTGRLGGMWVDSNFRRKGVGIALFEEVLSWAKRLNFSQIKLWVEDSESGAKIFYSTLGFKETGETDTSKSKISKNLCEMIMTIEK